MITINNNPIKTTLLVLDVLVKDMDAVQDWPEYASEAMIVESIMVAVYAKTARQRLWNLIDETNRHNAMISMREAGVSGRL